MVVDLLFQYVLIRVSWYCDLKQTQQIKIQRETKFVKISFVILKYDGNKNEDNIKR